MGKVNKQELINFFLLESKEHFSIIFNGINVLISDPNNWSIIEELFRSTHTLKGSSAMVGFDNFSKVVHSLENILESVKNGEIQRDKKLFVSIMEIYHRLNEYLEKEKSDLTDKLTNSLMKKITSFLIDDKLKEEKQKIQKPSTIKKTKKKKPSQEKIDKEFPVKTPKRKIQSAIRLNIEKIDFLINLAGELVVSRNKQNELVKDIQQIIKELEYTKERMTKLLSDFSDKYMYTIETDISAPLFNDEFFEGEFDRYTDINIFTRQLLEIGDDISNLMSELFHKLNIFQNDLSYINKVTDSLEKNLTKMKLVPVKLLFDTANRTATITAMNENKEVTISIVGEKIEIDKSILDMMTDAFLHLVRNAVSHGIESKEERIQKGKTPEGHITLRAYRAGTSIIFEIEDDGRGIDTKKIKEKIVSMGIMPEYEVNELRMDDLLEYLFMPGFSTKDDITDVSGRGIGLDVVKKVIEKFGGNISIFTEKDKYTKFVLVIPITQFITEYLLIKENEQVFAIPIQSVYEIIPLDIDKIKKIGDHFFYRLRDEIFEVVDLMVALGVKHKNEFKSGAYGILVEGPRKKYIIQAENIIGRETTVTKQFKPFLMKLNKFLGTSISAKGEVRLIIDTIRLFSAKAKTRQFAKISKQDEKEKTVSYFTNGILVVDDSISVRKYLSDILSKNGFKVIEAKDGIEALNILETQRFPFIITDLEMPKLNGYELIDKIRNSIRDHSTKIYVVTSRATDKHREKAIELGANGFIIKPFTEDTILKTIKGEEYERVDV